MVNASKKTEDEMLQETFQNFETQTGTEDPTVEGAQKEVKKSDKKNTGLYVLVGVVGVGVLCYMFLLKPMLTNNKVQQQAQQQQPKQNAPVNVAVNTQPQPQIQQPVQPEVQIPIPSVLPTPPVVDPLSQLNGTNGQVNQPIQQPQQPIAPVDNFFNEKSQGGQGNGVPTPSVQVTTGQGGQPTQVAINVPTTHPNTSQDVVISDLQNRMESQNNELKSMLNGIDSRVGVLESKANDQYNLNDKVDQRLTALENGKVDKRNVDAPKVSNQGSAPKVTHQRKAPRKVVETVKKERELQIEDANVLVDKGGVRVAPQVAKKAPVEAANTNLMPIKIHSIYGKRIWTSNPNGTLSTFTEGDKLPSGEVIKSINDNDFVVTTNMRKIVKK